MKIPLLVKKPQGPIPIHFGVPPNSIKRKIIACLCTNAYNLLTAPPPPPPHTQTLGSWIHLCRLISHRRPKWDSSTSRLNLTTRGKAVDNELVTMKDIGGLNELIPLAIPLYWSYHKSVTDKRKKTLVRTVNIRQHAINCLMANTHYFTRLVF